MKSGVTIKFDKIKKVADSMRTLAENSVLVGVPQEKSPREDGPITNAVIGYLQETGVPENNLPARPHLVPGVNDSRGEWLPRMRDATKASFEGRLSAVTGNLNAAGLTAQNAVRKKIQDGIEPELAESTIAARMRKNKKAAAVFTPLINTGNYIKSIIYVLRKGR